MWGIEGSVASAMQEAPKNIFIGLAHAAMFIPEKAKAAFIFGQDVFNGMSPEDQKVVEDAVRKLIVEGAKAYVKSGG